MTVRVVNNKVMEAVWRKTLTTQMKEMNKKMNIHQVNNNHRMKIIMNKVKQVNILRLKVSQQIKIHRYPLVESKISLKFLQKSKKVPKVKVKRKVSLKLQVKRKMGQKNLVKIKMLLKDLSKRRMELKGRNLSLVVMNYQMRTRHMIRIRILEFFVNKEKGRKKRRESTKGKKSRQLKRRTQNQAPFLS